MVAGSSGTEGLGWSTLGIPGTTFNRSNFYCARQMDWSWRKFFFVLLTGVFGSVTSL